MALVPRQAVSVGTTATRLDAEPTDGVGRSKRRSVLLVAQASGTLVVGPSGVTAANGCRCPVVVGTTVTLDLEPGEALYGVVASGTLLVDVLLESA